MDDFFPELLKPAAIGLDAVRYMAPMFFAIYPSAEDLPRLLAWRRQICNQKDVPSVALRPATLLHISVADAGVPRRLREPLEVALRLAAARFSYRPFELTLDALAGGFGGEGRALVALADASSANNVNGLRIALADAQKPLGLSAGRGAITPHLTLGYGDDIPSGIGFIQPISFRVEAVDLVVSMVGHAQHQLVTRWMLT